MMLINTLYLQLISTLSFVGGLHLNTQEVNPSGIAFIWIKKLLNDGDEVNEYVIYRK